VIPLASAASTGYLLLNCTVWSVKSCRDPPLVAGRRRIRFWGRVACRPRAFREAL